MLNTLFKRLQDDPLFRTQRNCRIQRNCRTMLNETDLKLFQHNFNVLSPISNTVNNMGRSVQTVLTFASTNVANGETIMLEAFACWKPLHVPLNQTNVKRADKLSNTNAMRLNLKGNKGLEIFYLKQKFMGTGFQKWLFIW